MEEIKMVDLAGQYLKIKDEIDQAIAEVLNSTAFINGPDVKKFSENLAKYLNIKKVIPCGNGTDALQIALMALGLRAGDEVIVPAFTYVATAEVVGLLGLKPVLIDVDYRNFNIKVEEIEQAISSRTKAIVPVHLFGQSADMEPILLIAEKYNLYVVEDNAQAIGAEYRFSDGTVKKTGTMGNIGCTSFFPSKNLGCYGDGGAMFTDDEVLGQKLSMISNHGQNRKYNHKYIGVNSRLDTIQAAILNVKLKYLAFYNQAREKAANYYTNNLKDLDQILTPMRMSYSTHVYHQYTIIVRDGDRDKLKEFLNNKGIPANVYYPLPLNDQEAFKNISEVKSELKNTKELTRSVLSLPMHTELTVEQQNYIIENIYRFFGQR